MTQTVPPRSDIPVQHTWDTQSVFPSDSAWEDGFARVEAMIAELDRFPGHLSDGPDSLADWLSADEALYRAVGKVYVYASMLYNTDTADGSAQAKYDRALGLAARTAAATAFAEPELLAIGFGTLRRWVRDEERLHIYEHYFDELERRQSHVRSAEVEELLGLVQDSFRTSESIHGVLADSDLTFSPARGEDGQQVEITQGNYHALLSSQDRETRRTAWEHYADAHLATKNSMASCISVGVKNHVFAARSRRYNSALEAALGPNHIPTDVFNNLLETFQRHLPIWHRYWSVRRRALGYGKLHVYDLWAPLGKNPPHVPYTEAIDVIAEGMRPLGSDYVDVLRRGAFQERWVDIYPNQRKSSGAFSTGWPGTHPFILVSYNDDIFSLSTLAHEFGHSMHSYYTWKTQPTVYAGYGIFVAEVASNFNQALVRAEMLRRDDPEFRLAVIEEAMANFLRYFFIMPTLARFELEIHKRVERGEALTAEVLNPLMAELFREGYGGEVEVDEERVGITWAEFSTHMYGNFYVWQYATGIAAANALAQGVLDGAPEAAERYLTFLRAGSSAYPLDALKIAGVDMASPEPVERAFQVLADMVERLARLVDERTPAEV